MIKDSNGKPYQVSGSIQQFDPDSTQPDLFNSWDEDAIRQGGSPIFYYECLIQNQTIDPIHLEDRGKLFSPIPVQLWCYYEPVRSQNLLGQFGIDAGMDEMLFELNYRATLKAIGHTPKIGSRIFTPHLRENWVIIQCNTGEYKMWDVLRLQIVAQKFQESTTTGEGKVTQKMPDFKII